MPTFNEFMKEEKPINRWLVLKIALLGALSGVLLTTVFLIGAIV